MMTSVSTTSPSLADRLRTVTIVKKAPPAGWKPTRRNPDCESVTTERTFRYESPMEARRQLEAWIAEAIRFAPRSGPHAGLWSMVITLGPRSYHVGTYASGQTPDVYETGPRSRRFWTSDEVRACYDRRWNAA